MLKEEEHYYLKVELLEQLKRELADE